MTRAVPLYFATFLVLGCAGSNGEVGGAAVDRAVMGDLATSMEVKVEADRVGLSMHVTNVSGRPLEFTFPSSQRFDFVVLTETGDRVWQWSSDMAFLQAITEATLGAGETWDFEAEWESGGRSGTYEARGWVTAQSRTAEQRMMFELP